VEEVVLRYHFIFKGRVQGVGFRFTTERIASRYGIVGWVRNNADGTVEVVAEGEKEKLNLFSGDIENYFKSYISGCSREISPATGEFKDFRITFY